MLHQSKIAVTVHGIAKICRSSLKHQSSHETPDMFLQVSVARQASGHGYTVVLCILAAVVLVPLSIIRASPNPVVGKGFGILTNTMFAVLLVNGQFVWPASAGAKTYWNYVGNSSWDMRAHKCTALM